MWVKEEIKNVICVLWERSFIHQEKDETLIGKLNFLKQNAFFYPLGIEIMLWQIPKWKSFRKNKRKISYRGSQIDKWF